jgi:hypothetical protein
MHVSPADLILKILSCNFRSKIMMYRNLMEMRMLRMSELPTYIALWITTLLKQGVETRKSKKWTYDTAVGHGDGNYTDTYFSVSVILPKYARDGCNSRIAKQKSCNYRNFDSAICCADLSNHFFYVQAFPDCKSEGSGLRAQGKGYLTGY